MIDFSSKKRNPYDNYYILPENNLAYNFFSHLRERFLDSGFQGYLDQQKNPVQKVLGSTNSNATFLIISPNYGVEIYNTLVTKGISKKQIFFVDENSFATTDSITWYLTTRAARRFFVSLSQPRYNISRIRFWLAVRFGVRYLRNEKRLSLLKNKHYGRRAFLIGNGPSLRVSDLSLLEGEVTFASNKIYLAFGSTSWRPTYYCVEDDQVFLQNYTDIHCLSDVVKLVSNSLLQFGPPINDAIYFNHRWHSFFPGLPDFSVDPFEGVYWGSTITYTMVQLALYMGIKEIYLLGIDFKFEVPESSAHTDQLILSVGEQNHFHQDYRKKGERWNKPNLHMQRQSFKRVMQFCETNDIKIYNLSRQTELDLIPLQELQKVMPIDSE
jgi:hypothetical protein